MHYIHYIYIDIYKFSGLVLVSIERLITRLIKVLVMNHEQVLPMKHYFTKCASMNVSFGLNDIQ